MKGSRRSENRTAPLLPVYLGTPALSSASLSKLLKAGSVKGNTVKNRSTEASG
jgi:hypothetical protein